MGAIGREQVPGLGDAARAAQPRGIQARGYRDDLRNGVTGFEKPTQRPSYLPSNLPDDDTRRFGCNISNAAQDFGAEGAPVRRAPPLPPVSGPLLPLFANPPPARGLLSLLYVYVSRRAADS